MGDEQWAVGGERSWEMGDGRDGDVGVDAANPFIKQKAHGS